MRVASSCNRYLTGEKGFLGLDMALSLRVGSGGVIKSVAMGDRDFCSWSISLSPTRLRRELWREAERSASGVDMARRVLHVQE